MVKVGDTVPVAFLLKVVTINQDSNGTTVNGYVKKGDKEIFVCGIPMNQEVASA